MACAALILSCFMPWTFYADIRQTFTGFFSYKNEYGRPGMLLVPVSVVVVVLMQIRKLWSKRVNLFLTALTVGYSIKTYILFTSCYNAYCPQKLSGIYIMLFSSVTMLISAIFSDFKIEEKKK